MGWRFRKRSSLLGGLLNINWSKNGLSSVSVGGGIGPFRNTINLPVARSGGVRQTSSVYGTGLSYVNESSRPSIQQRRQIQRPTQTTTESIINQLMTTLVGPTCIGDALWRQELASRVIEHDSTPRAVRSAAQGVKSPEMVELRLRRARGVAATRRAARDVIRDVKTVISFTEEMGWSVDGESD